MKKKLSTWGIGYDICADGLMELPNSTLLRFMYDQRIPRPKDRRKAAYAAAIMDFMNKVEIDICLGHNTLAINVTCWNSRD